ncbi:cation diffusion facilitator family transporter [Faecalibacterium prausnitzii]|jgi:cation diffusion facilitator family transporter|uniref:Cation-efflux pump n=1 Tax=Faecalibacterium prausnitzii TaxID=853 RepID=A0A329UA47_9FIRM|nr:cation diffusion facilitator family transporter [Faecalibacterium prausnitzii]RAW58305.1 cation-efflux pump [Faecalibacterium prausnitzii]
MTQFLIRCFIKRPDDVKDAAVRTAYGNLASLVGMACNILLCIGKLLAGTLFGSIAIMADALNNLSDASSNVVSLIGFRLAAKAPDAEHPYGHARYEYLAGLVVSVTILAIGLSLLKESALKVLHPTPVAFSWLSIGVLAASILVKLWLSGFNRAVGKKINSETLMATAADSRNDVLTTGAVLLSTILCSLTGYGIMDGIMGVGVAAFILWSGWGLVMDTLSPLLGESPSPELVEHIERTVMSYPGVLGVHDLMVHDYGPGHQFASLHVEFPAETDPLTAHDVIDNIENDFLKKDRLQVTIHYDPIVTADASVGVLRARLQEHARQLDPQLSIHDLRIVPGDSHTNVLFDLVFPAGYTGDIDQMLAKMCQFVKEQDPKYCCVVKVEQSYASALPDKK